MTSENIEHFIAVIRFNRYRRIQTWMCSLWTENKNAEFELPKKKFYPFREKCLTGQKQKRVVRSVRRCQVKMTKRMNKILLLI